MNLLFVLDPTVVYLNLLLNYQHIEYHLGEYGYLLTGIGSWSCVQIVFVEWEGRFDILFAIWECNDWVLMARLGNLTVKPDLQFLARPTIARACIIM